MSHTAAEGVAGSSSTVPTKAPRPAPAKAARAVESSSDEGSLSDDEED